MSYLLAMILGFVAILAGYGTATTLPRRWIWVSTAVCCTVTGWGAGQLLATVPGHALGLFAAVGLGAIGAWAVHAHWKR